MLSVGALDSPPSTERPARLGVRGNRSGFWWESELIFLRPMIEPQVERDLFGVLKASLESIDIRVGVYRAVTLHLTVVAARDIAIRGTSEESMSIVRLTGRVRLIWHMKETGPQSRNVVGTGAVPTTPAIR